MAISLLNAEAARNALCELKAGAFFSVIRANKHIFEKHGESAKALAAAKSTGIRQGYFTKEKTTFVTSYKGYGNLSQKKQRRFKESYGLLRLKPKELGEHINKTPDLEVKGTSSAGQGIFDLIALVIRSADQGLYETDDYPDSRFLIISSMPDGFVGKSIESNGTKTAGLPYAVVVINASSLTSPEVVTAYPITQNSLNARTALV